MPTNPDPVAPSFEIATLPDTNPGCCYRTDARAAQLDIIMNRLPLRWRTCLLRWLAETAPDPALEEEWDAEAISRSRFTLEAKVDAILGLCPNGISPEIGYDEKNAALIAFGALRLRTEGESSDSLWGLNAKQIWVPIGKVSQASQISDLITSMGAALQRPNKLSDKLLNKIKAGAAQYIPALGIPVHPKNVVAFSDGYCWEIRFRRPTAKGLPFTPILIRRRIRPEDGIRAPLWGRCPATCNPDAVTLANAFELWATGEDLETLSLWIGSVASGQNLGRQFMILKGSTRTGKSGLIRILLKYVFGGRVGFIKSKGMANEFSPTAMAPYRVIVNADAGISTLSEDQMNYVKSATGNDPQGLAHKHKDGDTQQLLASHMLIATNHDLEVKDAGDAIKDRAIVLQLTPLGDRQISDIDEHFDEHHGETVPELALHYAIKAATMIKNKGIIQLSAEQMEAVEELTGGSTEKLIRRFINSRCVSSKDDLDTKTAKEIKDQYTSWGKKQKIGDDIISGTRSQVRAFMLASGFTPCTNKSGVRVRWVGEKSVRDVFEEKPKDTLPEEELPFRNGYTPGGDGEPDLEYVAAAPGDPF